MLNKDTIIDIDIKEDYIIIPIMSTDFDYKNIKLNITNYDKIKYYLYYNILSFLSIKIFRYLLNIINYVSCNTIILYPELHFLNNTYNIYKYVIYDNNTKEIKEVEIDQRLSELRIYDNGIKIIDDIIPYENLISYAVIDKNLLSLNLFAKYTDDNLILNDSLISVYLIINKSNNILKEIKNNIDYHIKYGKINIDIFNYKMFKKIKYHKIN